MTSTMLPKPVPEEPATVACEVCLEEIPNSVSMNSEATDYAQHYCGIECYQQWLATRDGALPADQPHHPGRR